jgi:DNA-binding HxlR family transcriptional regulator
MLALDSMKQPSNVSASRSKQCPVGMDLAALGKKWTFHILRNIGILHINRFNQILRSLPGLTPRVLIMRLDELEKCGLIRSVVIRKKPRFVRWLLTEKGNDTIPILEGYGSYVRKWHPNATLSNHLGIERIKQPNVLELIQLAQTKSNRLTGVRRPPDAVNALR